MGLYVSKKRKRAIKAYVMMGSMCGVVILAIVAVIMLTKARREESKAIDVVNLFTMDNFTDMRGTVKITGTHGNAYMTVEEKIELLKGVAEAIGIHRDMEVNYVTDRTAENEKRITVSLTRSIGSAKAIFSYVSIEHEKSHNVINLEQYLISEIEIDNSLESLTYYSDTLRAYYKSEGIEATDNTEVVGYRRGKLTMENRDVVTDTILDRMNAKVITENRREENYVVYGFTKRLKNYIVYGSGKINVTVSIDYIEETDLTEIVLSW